MAFGVVVACNDGIEHLEIARAIDEQGDVLAALLAHQLEEALGLLREGNIRRAEGMIRVSLTTLARLVAADQAEQEHWSGEAPIHVTEARDEGRAIAVLCDRPAVAVA